MTTIINIKPILLALAMLTTCLIAEGQNFISLSHKFVADSLAVSFTNVSQTDTAYLFSSYFQDLVYYSRYTHRYNKKEGAHKVSFIPFSSRMSVNGVLNCRVFFDDRKLIEHSGMRWEFIPIFPMQSATVNIPISALTYDSYTKDFNMKEIKIYTPKIKFKPVNVPIKKLFIEFVYFTDITWLGKRTWTGEELETLGENYTCVRMALPYPFW